MAISNIHETLLMYTKQKSMINNQLSDVLMDMMTATRQTAEKQQEYNTRLQNAYYDEDLGYFSDAETEDGKSAYMDLVEQMENNHEFELATLNAWESELELKKNTLETRLNEITTYETSWTKLLQTNIKNDFSYGGAGK